MTLVVPTVRRPTVAGYWYPADASRLAASIRAAVPAHAERTLASAVLVPHGSWVHAGTVLAETFGRVEIPRRCLIMGASHTGTRAHWSLASGGAYRTPLGELPIDEQAVDRLSGALPQLQIDDAAHVGEHSIEVVLPWLQALGPSDLRVVGIIAGSIDPAGLSALAEGVTDVLERFEEPTLIIMSSDLSHYLSEQDAWAQDHALLERILQLDAAGLLRYAEAQHVVMCGDGAVACGLEVAVRRGATEAFSVAYGTSAQTGGDPASVIGYAGAIVHPAQRKPCT